MPNVRLVFEGGQSGRDSGGCFGFSGRHGDCRTRFRNDCGGVPVTNYIYEFYNSVRGDHSADSDAKFMLDYLATQSPWRKYVNGLNIEQGRLNRAGNEVDIKTDIPGHAVIGTASMFRFVVYLHNGNKHVLKAFKTACDLGCNPNIAFVTCVLGYGLNSQPQNSAYSTSLNAYPDIGDDTPFDFSRIALSDFQAIIAGTWEYKDNDSNPFPKYRDTGRYQQEILNSFRTGNFSFPQYVQRRFYQSGSYVAPRSQGSRGLGRSTSQSLTVHNNQVCIEPLSLIGVALQLDAEVKKFGTFQSINLHHGV